MGLGLRRHTEGWKGLAFLGLQILYWACRTSKERPFYFIGPRSISRLARIVTCQTSFIPRRNTITDPTHPKKKGRRYYSHQVQWSNNSRIAMWKWPKKRNENYPLTCFPLIHILSNFIEICISRILRLPFLKEKNNLITYWMSQSLRDWYLFWII